MSERSTYTQCAVASTTVVTVWNTQVPEKLLETGVVGFEYRIVRTFGYDMVSVATVGKIAGQAQRAEYLQDISKTPIDAVPPMSF